MSHLAAAVELSRPVQSSTDPVQAGGLRVELRRNLDLRPEDAAALEGLVERRPDIGLFASKAWLSGFFADAQPSVEAALVLLREGRALRGVVPIAIRASLTHIRVTLLGGGLGSDRVDLVAARGFEMVAADTFLAWLGATFGPDGFLLELRDVPASSPLWGAIYRAGVEQTQRLALQPREISTLPYLVLNDPEPGELDDTPAGRRLRSLEKHRRWFERRCRSKIELLENLDEVMNAFECLTRFLGARWRGRGEGSALDDPRMLRFHRHVLPLLLIAGRLRMIRLSVDARTVAVFYGLASGRWWGYYLAGYDREWAGRVHLGQIMIASAIELASREGAHEFDFLKGAERMKYTWPVRERATLDADVFSETSGAQLTRATRSTRDAAAALTKSARHLFKA